jgi:glucosylglycerol phosphorylase (configuration-retaining)
MSLKNQIQLICYPNRIGDNLTDLAEFIENRLPDIVGGVHLLPLFPSNADAGFSPLTHLEVDPEFGEWADVERISRRFDLCIDLILNHISDASPEFLDFQENGFSSPYADLFVHVDHLGEPSSDDLSLIHIRKEKEPFREVICANGDRSRVWCTFTENQIDLNFLAPQTYELMRRYIIFLCARGAKLFRLDAFGYTTKRIGSTCFLVEPEVYGILDWFHKTAAEFGAEVLPEVHDHPSYQYAIAREGMLPYAFALPPLVLFTLLDTDSRYLKSWLRMCPHRQITVLDTHDGICIPDVEGLLPDDKISELVENVSSRGGDSILRRSAANVHSVGAIYQLTCTFYDALKQNDDAYICARAIQFFTPGIPQVYYVGLFAGSNDIELMTQTGEARDINRHFYSLEEADEALQKPVVQRLLNLMRFRNEYPAFAGRFDLHSTQRNSIGMSWRLDQHYCHLLVELTFRTATITYRDQAAGDEVCIRF